MEKHIKVQYDIIAKAYHITCIYLKFIIEV